MKRPNWHISPQTRVLLLASMALLLIIPLSLLETSAAAGDMPLIPVFSHPGGYYEDGFLLEISAPPEATIVFTLDGRIPALQTGAIYTQPILLSGETAVTVIRARAILPDSQSSPIVTVAYFIGIESALPLLSLVVAPDDLWDADAGIYANPLEKGIAWERTAVVAYIDEDRISGFQVPAGVRIHGGYTRTFDKKSFRLYFRDEYDLAWLQYPLFADSAQTRFKRLTLHSGAQDSPEQQVNWSLLRSQVIAKIAHQTGGYAPHSQPVMLFVNGEPWGIYQLRERIDERFFRDKYNMGPVELLDTPELNENRLLSDAPREHWDHLLQFVEAHDLADPAHYAYVNTQIDIANLIDYTIIQIYSANIDWPHRNMNMFRPIGPGGRWHWYFWDSDFSLALEPWSKADTNMVARSLAPEHPNTGGRDTLLLRKLLTNQAFQKRFLIRAADLLNTVLLPETVSGHIDALAAELGPGVVHESGRWSSSAQWETTIEGLHDFAQRRPDYVRQHLVERFGLAGTYSLTLNAPTGEGGYIAVNERLVPDLPWQGIYFQGVRLRVTAVPAPGYRFDGWEEMDGEADLSLFPDTPLTLTPRFTAVAKARQ